MTKNNRSAVLALAAALSLMVPQALAGDFDATAARTKLAELIAYVRDGPAECGETAVSVDVRAEAATLYAVSKTLKPTDDEITAKQAELSVLRSAIGVAKWCDQYRIALRARDTSLHDFAARHAPAPPALLHERDCSTIPPKDRTLDCQP